MKFKVSVIMASVIFTTTTMFGYELNRDISDVVYIQDERYYCPEGISEALKSLSNSINNELNSLKSESKETRLTDAAKEVEYFDTIKLVKQLDAQMFVDVIAALEKKQKIVNQMVSEVCVPSDSDKLETKVSPEDFFKDIEKYLKQL